MFLLTFFILCTISALSKGHPAHGNDELPKIVRHDCEKIPNNVNSDLCLRITFKDMKEYGLLKMVNGDMEIFEGVLVDAKGSEMEGSQITLTIDNGQALVSMADNDEDQSYHLKVDLESGKTSDVKLKHPVDYNNLRHDSQNFETRSIVDVDDELVATRQATEKLPKQGMTLRLQVVYDAKFKKKFGSKARSNLDKIIAHTKTFFAHKSLGTTIFLNSLSPYFYDPKTYPPFSSGEKAFGKSVAKHVKAKTYPTADVYAALSVQDDNESGGSSTQSGICMKDVSKRICIARFNDNAITTAMILTHELGHVLGMTHDFRLVGTEKAPKMVDRYDSKKKRCKGQRGFMDYIANPNKWSTCSVEDFIKFYNKIHKANGKFCLALGDQAKSTTTTTTTTAKPATTEDEMLIDDGGDDVVDDSTEES